MKLMIVDDSNIIRSRIEKAYKDQPGDTIVATANNGGDAVAKEEETQPDIITMDLTMPGMNGLQCIKHIINNNDKIKILVVSALSDVATGLEAIEYGARGFLPKPFTNDDLISAINQVINADKST